LNLEDIKGKDLRSINQVYINLDEVISALRENKTKIRGVRVRSDKDAHYVFDGMEVLGDELLEKLNSLPGMEGLFSQLMDVPYQ